MANKEIKAGSAKNEAAENSRTQSSSTINISEESIKSNFDEKLFNLMGNIFFWSSIKNGDTEEIFYSGNIVSVTGYTPDEIRRMPGRGLAIVHEADLVKIRKGLFDFIYDSERDNYNYVYRIIRKDKKEIWVCENIAVKRDNNGNAYSFNGLVTDITSIKNEQQELRSEIDGLKQTNDSKDKFISILSHDLRAPFTSILGFSEILINETGLSAAEKQEYLSYIHQSSQNQLQLINYLLDWTRLQTGRIKLEPQRLNVQTLIYNCISSLTGNAIRKNLDIKVHADEDLYVQADERLITQVITNILSNAIKFSPENKTVEISAEIFNDDFVEVTVKDYGIGISEQNKMKLFRVDKMFSTEGTKGEKGTGLGLSLVKEILDKHNSQIWFYSEPGQGSEFHFTIPCSLNTILIVENNPADKVLFEKIVKKYFPSFEILTASNGFEAVSVVSSKTPSLIITDHDMPLMNGIQLIETIRTEAAINIPVIAIVTSIDNEIQNTYQQMGIISVLQKPVDIGVFCSKIKKALS